MNDDDEYSLHYEYSEKITTKDKVNVEALIKNIKQRGNPFDLDQSRGRGIMNIATDTLLENEKDKKKGDEEEHCHKV